MFSARGGVVTARAEPDVHKRQIAALRSQLRSFERLAAQESERRTAPTCSIELNEILPRGGFPCGGVTEVLGPLGGGCLTVALSAAAHATQQGQLAALVDGEGLLYPPAVLGVDWRRFCWVQPPQGRRSLWAAQQLAHSGAFALVLLDSARRLGNAEGRRLRQAAERGACAVVVIGRTRRSDSLPATLRLRVTPRESGVEVCVLHARGAVPGGTALVRKAG